MNPLKVIKTTLFNKTLVLLAISICCTLIQGTSAYSQNTSATFSYTGGVQTFTVPCGVFNLTIKAWGGGGSGGGADSYIGAPGGGGGFVSTDIAVTPGQVLTLLVGGGGGPGGNCAGNAPGGTGGWSNGLFSGGRGGNSGASGCSGGGGAGGGASAVFDGGTAIVVAGGGGGGSGGGLNSAGGAGGGGGQNGNTGSGCSIGTAGASSNGIGLQGGDRGGADGAGGGGGGGGYNGGSGGGSPPGCDCGGCGGGGGNSFSAGTNISIVNGSGQTAGNSGDADLPSGAAVGGYSSAGGNGFISLVYIDGTPVANFTATSVCKANQTEFTNTTVTVGTIASQVWDFGNGSPTDNSSNPAYTYPSDGNYNVTLTVTNSFGCSHTITKPVTVYPLPLANFTSPAVCPSQPMSFSDVSTVANGGSVTGWSWDFGDGTPLNTSQAPTHPYATAGTYTATLIATSNNGCKDTISKITTVHALPVAQFTTAPIVCHGKYALFNEASTIPATDTIQSWQWNFDDGSALLNQQLVTGGYLYAATGTYNVSLIVTSNFGCKDTVTKTLFVRPKPVANFGSTKVCDGTNTVFSDSSITASGSINAWGWDFADGSAVSISQNPSHLFANAGIHNVTLTVQNTFGCADTVTKTVQVYYNPDANFTTQDVCLNDSVLFTDSSFVHNSAAVTTYVWVFGDGTPTGSLQNPGHLYATEGTYSVTLLSTTNQGCSDAANKSVHVFDPPVSSFSVVDVCLADSAVFINSSANPAIGTIASWAWSFGDGITNTTTLDPKHLYPSAGTYAVTLITRSSNLACADTLTDSVTVFPMPVANFSANDICEAQAMNFNDSSTVTGNNTIAGWNWNFGDGSSSSTLQNPAHTYAAFGPYDVVLIAATNHGCKDTISKNVIVHPLPTASFSTANICLGDSAQFTNQSEIPSNTTSDVIQSWLWDFDDNTASATTPNSAHMYTSIGSYNVELKVISDFGCPDSLTKIVVVNPNPVVAFSASDTTNCEPLCINFTNASTVNPGSNIAWSWDLGDGTTTTAATGIYHCYSNDLVFAPKQFSVTLTVTSDSGCVSVLTKNNYITVYPEPVAAFDASPTATTITNPVVTITNLSTGADFWNWQFGNSDSSSLQNPMEVTYADTGSYTIRLITSTQYGCVDTSYQTVVINPDFTFYIPNAFTPNEDGINETFTAQGIFVNEFEMSIFDRWGKLIYKTDDINKPWDGKFNNGMAPQEVYVYSIKIVDFKLAKHQYRGTVTLIR